MPQPVNECWAQGGPHYHADDGSCPYICSRCGYRKFGALGHGECCSCRPKADLVENAKKLVAQARTEDPIE